MLIPRLDALQLNRLPAGVARPAYDRSQLAIGIVHLGVGNFFRAHAAVYVDDVLARGDLRWGICGVSLRHADTADALGPQQGLYSVLTRDAQGVSARVVGALAQLRVSRDDPAPVIRQIAAPATHWVTLTITEKGYTADPAQGAAGAVGLLHAGLVQRARDGGGPVTVVSCDNLSANGDRLAEQLRDYDHATGGALAGWLHDHVVCPNTMVDRIVPRTVEADRMDAARLLGCVDAWPVPAEPFGQWVIEDRFAGPSPDFDPQAVQRVADIAPWEQMKLRLLNAAHSAIAYLGMPAGLDTVDRAMREPALRQFMQRLWFDEVAGTLPAAVQPSIAPYCASLVQRFDNPGLRHATAQIAMDGSQKIPMRWLPTIRARRAAGQPCPALALCLAAWIRYLGGVDEAGRGFAPVDPLAERLRARLAAAGAGSAGGGPAGDRGTLARTRAILTDATVFGDLGDDAGLTGAVAGALGRLESSGSLATLHSFCLQDPT